MNRTLAVALLGALAVTSFAGVASAQDMHSGVYPVPNPKGSEST